MAPSERAIIDAIQTTVRRMFYGPDRDELSVNNVRAQVEKELKLGSGFLKDGAWKQKAKDTIKAESEVLLAREEAGEEPLPIEQTPTKPKVEASKKSKTAPAKTGKKRSSEGDAVNPRKRQKKEDTPVSADEESELTSIENTPEDSEDNHIGDATKVEGVKKTTKEALKQKKETKPANREGKAVRAESDALDVDDNQPEDKKVKAPDKNAGSDSEMSVLLDEESHPKRKSKSSSKPHSNLANAKTSNPPKGTRRSKASKPAAELTPDEAELKILQNQLTKCGVRKIWGVLLKDYGSDTKAKIRHLKGMLKDVGMEGRFSEAKAAEIKEARELLADLEAVKEGDAIWGMGREGRSAKGRPGTYKDDNSDEDEDEDEKATRSKDMSAKPPTRVAKAKMDLAFLGDESDSD